MSDSEDPQNCHVCATFEPQAWRKSLCRNCFHSLEEHSEELLAKEAEAVAKEKDGDASKETGASLKDQATSLRSSKLGVALPEKDAKAKSIVEKDDAKAALPKDASSSKESAKAGPKGGSTVSMMSGKIKSPLPTSSSPSKSPPKTTVASSATTSTSASPASASSASSLPASSTTSTTAQKTSVSLAKNFASKFESKASSLAKDKSPSSKITDIRGPGASVSVLTGKISSEPKADSKSSSPVKSLDTKATGPLASQDSKTADATKSLQSKTDVKKSTQVEPAGAEAKSPLKDEGTKNIDDKSKSVLSDAKEKKLPPVNKAEDKVSLASRSKAAPFGKDMLKSKKDTFKKEASPVKETSDINKSKDNGTGKAKPSSPKSPTTLLNDRDKSSVLSKVSPNRSVEEKTKKNGDNSIKITDKLRPTESNVGAPDTKSSSPVQRSSQAPEPTDSAGASKTGQQTKHPSGKASDSKAGDQASEAVSGKSSDIAKETASNNKKDSSPKASPAKSDRDKSSPYRDRGKDEKKSESSLSPSSAKSPATSTSKSSPPSTSKSQSKSTSDKLKDAKPDTGKDSKPAAGGKLKELDTKTQDKPASLKTQQSGKTVSTSEDSGPNRGEKSVDGADNDLAKRLTEELKDKAEALSALTKQLAKMEEQIKSLQQEKEKVRKETAVKDDLEKLLKELRTQVNGLESNCSRLEKDNKDLLGKLRELDSKKNKPCDKKHVDNSVLEEDLEAAEKELEEVKEENKDLQSQIMEMRNEMDEMYDHFRESEHDEFRELQKELDLTAKNCRILQFKLRKAERRSDQIEEDKVHYEEKLRRLQDQFDSQDAKSHIRVLEEELRMAKEVSVRLHDELDIVEDKRSKTLEENRHLTELLEHTDKRQFRMEMEIDKLRDLVSDLRQQLKEAKGLNNNKESSSPDRKVLSGIYTRSID